MGGKVNDSVEMAVGEEGLGRGSVGQIDIDPLGADARNGFDAVEHFGPRVVEVVGQDHAVAAGNQVHGGVRADVAEAAGYKYGLHLL